MARYFLEVAYKGTYYSGFQVQQNANSIQAEIEKAFFTVQRTAVVLTGSSRTDAGVHAMQNYFHFDFMSPLHHQLLYKMNAILPGDIVVRSITAMKDEAHARFDATSRTYQYHIYQTKNPFLTDTALYYPYKLNLLQMNEGAACIKKQTNFLAFSKTNTQVKNFICHIYQSQWEEKEGRYVYTIEANRFLRGMVRLLTGTMLLMGRNKLALADIEQMFAEEGLKSKNAVAAKGLFLMSVQYPENFFL